MGLKQVLVSASIAGLLVSSVGAAALAQETQPLDEHPVVGTWTVTAVDEVSDDGEMVVEPEVLQFGADGNVSSVSALGTGLGLWVADGENAATATVLFAQTDEDGLFAGLRTVRATLEVTPDGGTLGGDVTVELTTPDGTTGQLGPRSVAGTRVAVEAPEEAVAAAEPLVAGPGTTDCAGAPVLVDRSLREFRLTGDCPSVTIDGTLLIVDAQDIGELEIRGVGNSVTADRVDSALISGRGNDLSVSEIGSVTILGNGNAALVRGPIGELIVDGWRNDVGGQSIGSVVSNGRFNDIDCR